MSSLKLEVFSLVKHLVFHYEHDQQHIQAEYINPQICYGYFYTLFSS